MSATESEPDVEPYQLPSPRVQEDLLADVSCTQYVSRPGRFPEVLPRSRWSELLALPRFGAEGAEHKNGRTTTYRGWLRSCLSRWGCTLLEPAFLLRECEEGAQLQSAISGLRAAYAAFCAARRAGGNPNAAPQGLAFVPEHEIQEGMFLCPFLDLECSPQPKDALARAAESFLERLLAPREALMISFRSRGVGSTHSYLDHWHTDFDVRAPGGTHRGEQVLTQFLLLWLPVVLEELGKKLGKHGSGAFLSALAGRLRLLNGGRGPPVPGDRLSAAVEAAVKELADILDTFRYDVVNLWFTLDSNSDSSDPAARRPGTALCFQSKRVLEDPAMDDRLLDEFAEDSEEIQPGGGGLPPNVHTGDLLAAPLEPPGETALLFRSCWVSHRSCALKFSSPEKEKTAQFRRNNFEARFLLLEAGGLEALARWAQEVTRLLESEDE